MNLLFIWIILQKEIFVLNSNKFTCIDACSEVLGFVTVTAKLVCEVLESYYRVWCNMFIIVAVYQPHL